jgi:hypothetical protein
MKDDFDIEDALRLFQCEPGAHTRHSVLDEFRRTHRRRGLARGVAGFLKHRVPLYAVAAALLICVGLSFRAGQWTGGKRGPSGVSQKPIELKHAESSVNIQWVVAENDLL